MTMYGLPGEAVGGGVPVLALTVERWISSTPETVLTFAPITLPVLMALTGC